MSDNPYQNDLRQAVADAYAEFGYYKISNGLEVCLCNVCMDEATRQAIIKTPVAKLPAKLIQEYTNSAHGVPFNTDDLKAILPRYLDLLSQNAQVDYMGVGCELRRFGDAIRENPQLFTACEQAVYHNWARAMFWVVIWDSLYEDEFVSPETLTEILITGGVPAKLVLSWWDRVFDHDVYGLPILIFLCRYLLNSGSWTGWGSYNFKVYALEYTDQDTIDTFYAWLNSPDWDRRLIEVDFDKISADDAEMLSFASDIFGKFNPEATELYRIEYRL